MKHFLHTDDEGCEHTTELPLQNMITNQDEQSKKETTVDPTRAVQHVDFLNYDHPTSHVSPAGPDEHSAVSDFWLYHA